MEDITKRIDRQTGAALIIDYGEEQPHRESLQGTAHSTQHTAHSTQHNTTQHHATHSTHEEMREEWEGKMHNAYVVVNHAHVLPGVRAHKYTSILDSPGEVDLTALVDFRALRST